MRLTFASFAAIRVNESVAMPARQTSMFAAATSTPTNIGSELDWRLGR